MGRAESTGAVFGGDRGEIGGEKGEILFKSIETGYKFNAPSTWITTSRQMPENASMVSEKREPWGLVEIPIRKATASSSINAKGPSTDNPSDGLLKEDQTELSSPELSSSGERSLRQLSLRRISLRNRKLPSPLNTTSHTRLPSIHSRPRPAPSHKGKLSSVQQSSSLEIDRQRSTSSPIRYGASGRASSRLHKIEESKRQTFEVRRANCSTTPPIWTTPGPKWKGNVWRYDRPGTYSPIYPSSPSTPPRSVYSVMLHRQRVKGKPQYRDRKGKRKQSSQRSIPDGYPDFKSTEHYFSTEHNNWHHQRDSAWSINDKFHGRNIVFPRRFDDPDFNRLNEWWWARKKGADSHLGLGGWLSMDLLDAYVRCVNVEPDLPLGQNSARPVSGVRHQGGEQILCGICGSDGHWTRECECCDACFAFGHVATRCPRTNRHWMQDLATLGLWNGDVELVAAEGSSSGLLSGGSSSRGGSLSGSSAEGIIFSGWMCGSMGA